MYAQHMYRRLLLCSLSAVTAAIVFSSYDNGPYQGGAGNRTGSAGSTASCTGGGCHVANTANTQVSIALVTLGGQPAGSYVPGTTYKVIVAGSNTMASLPKFGFQASAVKAAATSTQAGSFASTSTDISVRNAGSLQLVEHNTPLAATSSSGNNNVYTASFNWTAPTAGTGPVRFYATLNAVNGNGTVSGDQPNTAPSLTIPEATTGITASAIHTLQLYPNPASQVLNLSLAAKGSVRAIILNIEGAVVYQQDLTANDGIARLDVATLHAGLYYVSLMQEGRQFIAPFVKQ